MDFQHEDLVELIKDGTNNIEHRVNKWNISIYFEQPNTIFLEIDRLGINQVIINLLSKSVKFTPPTDDFYIELIDNDKWIEFSIRG